MRERKNEEETYLEAARTISQFAYEPYSHLRVGAVLIGQNAKQYAGCNVENASYGLTLCAERVAAMIAVADGCRAFGELYLYVDSDELIYPCGACLQVLSEFARDLKIVVACRRLQKETTLLELMPQANQELKDAAQKAQEEH